MPRLKRYEDEVGGRAVQDLWTDIKLMHNLSQERTDYPTQKPEGLLDRIISASSNKGDLVADFFGGSGTTAAVAEKLGRRWIVTDIGKFAIHATRKRMIGVQRELKVEGKDYRAFEILNLGKYERQHYIGVNRNLREAEQQQQLAAKEAAFVDLILHAYRAEKTEGFNTFHGKKAGRLVSVGPVNLPVTRLFVEEVILECRQKHITRVDILGFEFEMGLFPNVLDEARSKGIDIAPKYIPAEVFDTAPGATTPTYLSYEPPPAWTQKNQFEAGLDTKIILHDALTLDLTLNPDYSQVETEDPQTTVNQRFEVYFPEKRPFFLDNASYFQTPENLFFSRNIVDPEFGARLTGKTGPWLLGFLAIDDREPGMLVAPDDPLYGDHAKIAVARIAHDIGQQSSIGVLATAYQFGPNTEINLSADTRLKLTPNLVFTAQAVRSQTHGMGFDKVFGADYYANLTWSSLHVNTTTKFLDRSPNFDSYLGFIPRVNIRQVEQDAAYKWHPESLFKSLGPQLTLIADWDHTRALQDWLVSPAFSMEFARQTYFTVGRTESLEVYENIPFRKHSTDVWIISEFSKTIAVSATYGAGARVNYYPGGVLLPFAAPGQDLNFKLTIRPRANIKIDETYIFSRLSTFEQSLIAEQYGNAVAFNSHLLRQTVNWQFTKPLSLRLILDYDAVLPNQSLVDLDRSKRLSANVLLTWLLRPGTAFYAGYTDIRENLALDSGVVNTIGNPNTTTGRQLFVKFSYLLRY
jgi:hypothetical protein